MNTNTQKALELQDASSDLPNEIIAATACNVIAAYTGVQGADNPTWENASDDHKRTWLGSVNLLQTVRETDEEMHNTFSQHKKDEGWVYGPEYDADAKTDPTLVDFDKLPEQHHVCNALVRSSVNILSRVQIHNRFMHDVVGFNLMYGLPIAAKPTTELEPVLKRMTDFKVVITNEVNEVDDIIRMAQEGAPEIEQLVAIADWLCDIMVYVTSEGLRFGIPMQKVLSIIMDSNRSKLGADGLPIISGGKVQKGPNYWKPEPKIREVLEALIKEADEAEAAEIAEAAAAAAATAIQQASGKPNLTVVK